MTNLAWSRLPFLLLAGSLAAGELRAGVGTWLWDARVLGTVTANRLFSPSFMVIGAGEFSSSALARPAFIFELLYQVCGRKVPIHAWVQGNLPPKAVLSFEKGKAFGLTINTTLEGLCFKDVQLAFLTALKTDPLVIEWLRGMRAALDPIYRLRVTAPFLSITPGDAPSWPPDFARSVLNVVDTLDIAFHSSGKHSTAEFSQFLREQWNHATKLLDGDWGGRRKELMAGFSAFKSISDHHDPAAEKLELVDDFFKALPLAELAPLCNGRIQLAVFASFTMDDRARGIVGKMGRRIDEQCKKKPKS